MQENKDIKRAAQRKERKRKEVMGGWGKQRKIRDKILIFFLCDGYKLPVQS